MSQIGLTESVRGDNKRFEVWLQGRQEVHTLQAPTIEIKHKWVAEIKRVLLNQLEELKGEKIKQYNLSHRSLSQPSGSIVLSSNPSSSSGSSNSWDTQAHGNPLRPSANILNCDASSESSNRNSNCSSSDDNYPPLTGTNLMLLPGNSTASGSGHHLSEKDIHEGCAWSSDYSNSEDEMSNIEENSTATPVCMLPISISFEPCSVFIIQLRAICRFSSLWSFLRLFLRLFILFYSTLITYLHSTYKWHSYLFCFICYSHFICVFFLFVLYFFFGFYTKSIFGKLIDWSID